MANQGFSRPGPLEADPRLWNSLVEDAKGDEEAALFNLRYLRRIMYTGASTYGEKISHVSNYAVLQPGERGIAVSARANYAVMQPGERGIAVSRVVVYAVLNNDAVPSRFQRDRVQMQFRRQAAEDLQDQDYEHHARILSRRLARTKIEPPGPLYTTSQFLEVWMPGLPGELHTSNQFAEVWANVDDAQLTTSSMLAEVWMGPEAGGQSWTTRVALQAWYGPDSLAYGLTSALWLSTWYGPDNAAYIRTSQLWLEAWYNSDTNPALRTSGHWLEVWYEADTNPPVLTSGMWLEAWMPVSGTLVLGEVRVWGHKRVTAAPQEAAFEDPDADITTRAQFMVHASYFPSYPPAIEEVVLTASPQREHWAAVQRGFEDEDLLGGYQARLAVMQSYFGGSLPIEDDMILVMVWGA